ncbi:MAG: hypothetical protein QM809_14640 [Gordonia sp. (in: high G+C Gram-positive bacteria)]|uniref:hypothetical protein n=1 Tax=Gordonia sp. (in: high G+C Gram-positive bacteria) TaxID=84139 RepID=UPI0039E64573
MPFFSEHRRFIAVHAGLDEDAGEHWKLGTDPVEMIEKYPPSLGAHTVGKLIVAGHVGTRGMHRDGSDDPYMDEGHLYLDGSPENGGQLNIAEYDVTNDHWTFHVVTPA